MGRGAVCALGREEVVQLVVAEHRDPHGDRGADSEDRAHEEGERDDGDHRATCAGV